MRLLIAEDEKELRSSLVKFFKKRNFEVFEAENGMKALEILKKEIIDIIISDVKMPVLDGIELLRKVKIKYPDIEVILVTGFQDMEVSIAATHHHAYDYIKKPYDLLDLQNIIRRIKKERSLKKELEQKREEAIRLEAEKEFAVEKAKLETEKIFIEKDLALAREIQENLLPKMTPELPFLDIEPVCLPAKKIGGDFYDFINISENEIAIVLGDVVGKSIQGGILMATTITMLRAMCKNTRDIKKILLDTNEEVYSHSKKSRWITCIFAVYNIKTREFKVVNLGHTFVYLKRGNEEKFITTHIPPIGLSSSKRMERKWNFTTEKIEPGDLWFIYSDGITEALNSANKEYTEKRMLEVLRNLKDQPAKESMDIIIKDLKKFVGSAEQSDDITAVLIRGRSAAFQ